MVLLAVHMASLEPKHAEAGPPTLDWRVVSAKSEARLGDTGRVYERARWRLWSGRPERALGGLEDAREPGIFEDRIALVRGRASERLRDFAEARAAYLKALELAQAPAVSEEAARGLVRVLGKLGDWSTRLTYLDALISTLEDEPDHTLEIERARTLHRLGRAEEAKDSLWFLLDHYPDPRTAARAERALLEVEQRRRLSEVESRALQIARLRYLARTGRTRTALRELSRVRGDEPELSLLEADLWAARGRRSRAQSILHALARRSLEHRPAVALRLARLSRDRYQYTRARREYDAVVSRYAGTPEAIVAEYEAAAMEYDDDHYGAAAEKARRFVRRHPYHSLADDGRWLAGWSAWLSGDHAGALEMFETLEGPRGRFWLGRSQEAVGRPDEAVRTYRALVQSAPLTYYGLSAEDRLGEMGEDGFADPLPPVPAPRDVDEVIGLLGPERPLGIDRAAALFDVRLKQEGVEELLALAEHFRKRKDTQGATLVVDLFELFGKDAWAFLLARHIAEGDDPDDLERRPYYWRVWRYAFPTPFETEVRAAHSEHAVDPFLVYAVMRTESLFRPHAVSPVGARGLMQLMPATARWIGRRSREAKQHARRYRRPASNIWLGTWYLRFLLEHYHGDVIRSLAAYNAGPGAVDRWSRRFPDLEPQELVERIPYTETRRYVKRALESYRVYRRLHPPVDSVVQIASTEGKSG